MCACFLARAPYRVRAVKSLMPGQDLTRVTIPAFFLEPRSLLERMADTMMHPDLLLNVSVQEGACFACRPSTHSRHAAALVALCV